MTALLLDSICHRVEKNFIKVGGLKTLKELFDNNRLWAEKVKKGDPDFFFNLAQQQTPKYLWIGCSDSRVPANQIVGLMPGQIFVHRNVGNVVSVNDLNCMSVVQYAVSVLRVEHIILCGHYGCGGVMAAMSDQKFGLIDNWLLHIKSALKMHDRDLLELKDENLKLNRSCEVNVVEQVRNISQAPAVLEAWKKGEKLSIHSWIYGINDGLIKDLGVCISSLEEALNIDYSIQQATHF